MSEHFRFGLTVALRRCSAMIFRLDEADAVAGGCSQPLKPNAAFTTNVIEGLIPLKNSMFGQSWPISQNSFP